MFTCRCDRLKPGSWIWPRLRTEGLHARLRRLTCGIVRPDRIVHQSSQLADNACLSCNQLGRMLCLKITAIA